MKLGYSSAPIYGHETRTHIIEIPLRLVDIYNLRNYYPDILRNTNLCGQLKVLRVHGKYERYKSIIEMQDGASGNIGSSWYYLAFKTKFNYCRYLKRLSESECIEEAFDIDISPKPTTKLGYNTIWKNSVLLRDTRDDVVLKGILERLLNPENMALRITKRPEVFDTLYLSWKKGLLKKWID